MAITGTNTSMMPAATSDGLELRSGVHDEGPGAERGPSAFRRSPARWRRAPRPSATRARPPAATVPCRARQRHHHRVGDRENRDDRDRDGGEVRTEPEPQQQHRHQRDQRRGGERDEQWAEQPSATRAEMPARMPSRMPTAMAGRQAPQQDRRAGIDVLAIVCPTSRAGAPGSTPFRSAGSLLGSCMSAAAAIHATAMIASPKNGLQDIRTARASRILSPRRQRSLTPSTSCHGAWLSTRVTMSES